MVVRACGQYQPYRNPGNKYRPKKNARHHHTLIYPSYAGLQPEGLSERLRWVYTRTNLILKGISPRIDPVPDIKSSLLVFGYPSPYNRQHWHHEEIICPSYRLPDVQRQESDKSFPIWSNTAGERIS